MDQSPQDIRRIAVEAMTDPRTVARFLRGETVRPSIRQRIEKAVAAFEAQYGALARAVATSAAPHEPEAE